MKSQRAISVGGRPSTTLSKFKPVDVIVGARYEPVARESVIAPASNSGDESRLIISSIEAGLSYWLERIPFLANKLAGRNWIVAYADSTVSRPMKMARALDQATMHSGHVIYQSDCVVGNS